MTAGIRKSLFGREYRRVPPFDIVPDDSVCQLGESCGRLWFEVGVIQLGARVQLQAEIGCIIITVVVVNITMLAAAPFPLPMLTPPVQHSVRNVHAELTPPSFRALALRLLAGAMMREGFGIPGGMKDDAAHDPDQDQPYAA